MASTDREAAARDHRAIGEQHLRLHGSDGDVPVELGDQGVERIGLLR